MDKKFKRIIEYKKQKGSNRKPKYATRKLSIGLVSCMLGYALLVSPSSVEAAGLDSENQAVAEESAEPETTSEEDNLVEENKEETPAEGSVEEETPAPAEEKPEETIENTEAPTEKETTEEAPEEKEEAVVEDKEAFTLTEDQKQALKEADFTDSEIAKIEEEIANNVLADSNFDVEAFLDEKVAEKAPALEMGEENKPEAVAAPADENRAPKDISNEVTNINGSIEGLTNEDATTIKPIGQDTNLEGKDYDTQAEAILSFNVPNSTIEGDYVDITLSNNVSINGIVENVQPGQLDAYFGPEKIATASYDKATRTIRYTFTKAVESYGNVKVNTRFPLFIDKNVVTAPKSEQTIGVKVGDNDPIERTYTVDYHMDNIGGNDKYVSNGYSDITNVNREEGTYDHTIYINPLGKDQRGTELTIENLPGNSGVIFDQDVLDNVKLYVVKDPSNLAMSFTWDPDNLVEVGADGYTKTLDGDKIVLNIKNKVDPNNPNKPDVIRGDSVLVARYEGKFKNDAFDDAATRVTFDNGTPARADNFFWDNIIYTTDADASGTGDEEMGYFEDYHVYQTINEDGSITTDDFDFVPQQQGPESKKYTTVKKDREGYELVSVESPDGAVFDKDGAKTTGNFVNGKTLHVKYVYQKRPVEKKGSFQEHHIYQTKKLDGTIVKDDEVNKDVTEGTEKENYKTSKEDRAGYKLIEVKSSNGGQFNEDGSEKEAAYIADTKQEVTYIYQKEEVAKKGSFQEHHIYQTKKLDGTIVKDDEVNKDVTEGTEKENYKTSKEDRAGYKLIEVKSSNGGQFNEDGSEKEAAYIADTKQEVTYIYQKEEAKPWTPIEETGKFQEHHIYITKDKDGKEIGREVVDGKVSGGTKDMTYTTGKDEKDGFKFVRTENPVEEPTFDKDGAETKGNYKPGVTQEITYVYEKTETEWTPIEETGKFQEHHIYITKDKDGKEIKREVVDGKVSGGTKDMTYTTGKDEKDGFKFVRTEDAKENPSYDKDGKETTGNFKPGVTQEITYVYEKTETPWTPLEPSEPIEKDPEGEKPGKKDPKDPTPTTPGKPEPSKPEGKTSNGVKVPKVTGEKTSTKVERKSNNPKMGVESASGVIASLVAATGAMFASRKKKEDEDK